MAEANIGRHKNHKPIVKENGYVYLDDVLVHRAVVERAIGKPLRKSAPVHHVDENRQNNTNGNLVACDSKAYHSLLHQRMRALAACGDPNARKCRFCGSYDRQSDIALIRQGKYVAAQHRSCAADYARERWRRRPTADRQRLTARRRARDFAINGPRGNRGKRGDENHQAKLTSAQVGEIRALYAGGGVTHAELGRRFGVTRAAIGYVIRGITWT